MKKIAALLLAMIMAAVMVPAMAEAVVEYGVVYQVADGYADYFSNYDEQPGQMNITFGQNEEGEWDSFAITINGQYAEKQCEYLTGNVYAVRLNGLNIGSATMFMVEDWGLNDYHYSYCFMAAGGVVYDLGGMPGLPTDIVVNPEGTFKTFDRTDVLGTHNTGVEYVLANGGYWAENGTYVPSYALAKLPQEYYTLGTICTLNVDLPVLATILDTGYSATIAAGQQVVLTVSDMRSCAHVSTMDGSVAGWIWIDPSEFPTKIAVNGAWQEEDAVFSGIFYAG